MTQDFYDELAPFYHLLYPDWDASIGRQSRGLAHVLSEFDVPSGSDVLDAACGIGTQALGLAHLGYRVTASDLSPQAVSRAREEAAVRGLAIAFTVADLRHLSSRFDRRFPAVIACDNAIPHLLSDDDIRAAFIECRGLLEPGGVLLISVRDYAPIERRSPDIHSYGTRVVDDRVYNAEQVWNWAGDLYDLTLRLSEQRSAEPAIVHAFRSRYYAVELPTLEQLLTEAGFTSVVRRDAHFFQPLIVAINAPAR
ncbi:class I SAM-dependent methyltransferase [Synechococcus sp. CCAP 1479/9]|uniref:class I SAM-dependent methyltransferase n=1 Tax=Synechococcus sp. CCAP 1479/9 TaxID=1221593 RepID=UPI001C24ED31|nr:class I SAM-dependent methyltransferase [Synechococcus sp. CCAP 1479/9]